MKKAFILLVAVCCSALSYGQILFEKAYFIDNKGQRTDCLIKNLEWRSNPTWFEYKLSESDVEKKQTIANVSEFGINETSVYKRYTVNVERSQTALNALDYNKNPQWKTETVFLLLLVDGNAKLFSYTDGNITKYFYQTPSIEADQLVYIKYLVKVTDNDQRISENNYFRQQLSNAVRCEKMSDSDFSQLAYTKNSLVKHFLAYNACLGINTKAPGKNYDAALRSKTEGFSLSAQVGFHLGKVAVRDPYNYFNMSTDLQKSVFKIGLQAEYVLPFNKNTWSILVSPVYQKFDSSKQYVSTINNPGFFNHGLPVHYTLAADYSSIEVPVGLRHYFYLNQTSKLFVNIAYLIDFKNQGHFQITNTDNQANAQVDFEPVSSNTMVIGAGYKYKRISGELSYTLPRELCNYGSWSAKYSSFGLNLYYRIF